MAKNYPNKEKELAELAFKSQKKPDSNYACRKCHGTGRIGFHEGYPIACKCTRPKWTKGK